MVKRIAVAIIGAGSAGLAALAEVRKVRKCYEITIAI